MRTAKQGWLSTLQPQWNRTQAATLHAKQSCMCILVSSTNSNMLLFFSPLHTTCLEQVTSYSYTPVGSWRQRDGSIYSGELVDSRLRRRLTNSRHSSYLARLWPSCAFPWSSCGLLYLFHGLVSQAYMTPSDTRTKVAKRWLLLCIHLLCQMLAEREREWKTDTNAQLVC